jgi:hypothetical protein
VGNGGIVPGSRLSIQVVRDDGPEHYIPLDGGRKAREILEEALRRLSQEGEASDG